MRPTMTAGFRRKAAMWILALTCAYGAILAGMTLLNRFGADRYWFGSLNLYLPQIAWMAPGVLLTLLSLAVAWRWAWAPLLCVAWVLGPIMGFCWGTQGQPVSAGVRPVRIMTWNVKYGGGNPITQIVIASNINESRPDVVLMQDAEGLLNGPIGRLFGQWNVQSFGQYIIASRLPLDEAEVRWIPYLGEKHSCLRCRLHIGTKTLILYNVHFQSPRQGLDSLREARREPWHLLGAVRQLEDNAVGRLSQALALRELIRQEREPVAVAGDLNSTDASLACRTLRDAGLHDAFAEGGRGYGYTYGHFLLQHRLPWLGAAWMRIDHIMLSPHLRSNVCMTGKENASEHRPVIADVVFKGGM